MVAADVPSGDRSITGPQRPRLKHDVGPVTEETVDGRFFALMHLETPGLEEVRRLVQEGQYGAALKAWRDYVVLKLRERPAGRFRWHDSRLAPRYTARIDVLLGRKTDPDRPEDTSGITGPPGRGGRIYRGRTERSRVSGSRYDKQTPHIRLRRTFLTPKTGR
jgi:hypothetical protein